MPSNVELVIAHGTDWRRIHSVVNVLTEMLEKEEEVMDTVAVEEGIEASAGEEDAVRRSEKVEREMLREYSPEYRPYSDMWNNEEREYARWVRVVESKVREEEIRLKGMVEPVKLKDEMVVEESES